MRRAVALIALLVAPLPAAAETVEWKAPPIGLTGRHLVEFVGQSVEVTQAVTAVEGDEIVMASLPSDGSPDERYYRFLVSLTSQGATYGFDQAALATLWPLQVGKRAASKVRAMMQGQLVDFDWTAEVVAFEDVTVPGGSFRAVRIEHRLVAAALLTMETVTWLEAEWGYPVRTDTTIAPAGAAPVAFSMELLELTGLP